MFGLTDEFTACARADPPHPPRGRGCYDPAMGTDRWRPSVTVAAVIEDGGRYLLVEEHTPEGLRLNNPAGHLDPGETPEQGVVRETLEETARDFVPLALVGVYLARFQRPASGEDVTYLRFAYAGRVGEPIAGRALDTPIVRTLWLTPDEIEARRADWRSELVGRCIADHRAGRRFPLDLVQADPSLFEPVIKG
jgi:8-oxo-dGTP pyrophosphatase MutT (NUDIX family)